MARGGIYPVLVNFGGDLGGIRLVKSKL